MATKEQLKEWIINNQDKQGKEGKDGQDFEKLKQSISNLETQALLIKQWIIAKVRKEQDKH